MTGYVLKSSVSDPSAPVYRFNGSRRREQWPTSHGAGLGGAGCWNFLLRIGLRPQEITPAEVRELPEAAPLLVSLDGPVPDAYRDAVLGRVRAGGCVVGGGDTQSWAQVFPVTVGAQAERCGNPYSALGYRFGRQIELMSPGGWPFTTFKSLDSEARTSGEVVTIGGERQTPARALIASSPHAPAIVRWHRFVFLNGAPFHAFQAWAQGQEDLQPWMEWRHRLFWLDEWVAAVRTMLVDCGVALSAPDSLPVPELGRTTVVLRHDLDYSRDASYLELEAEAGIPAVHAILRDANTRFWVAQLRKHPAHESAFHYNTARYSRLRGWLEEHLGAPQRPYVPDRKAVVRSGLLEQVRWASRRGIGIATLHRHLPMMIYPEWIDALDAIGREEPSVLGGSSMFRAQVLRWGVDRSDGGRGTYSDHPDVHFPVWFPFRLAHAADGGRLLRVWESASVLEIEPELLEQMLEHHVPGLPQRVFTLNFHPAHARRATFTSSGSLEHFRRVLAILRAADVRVLTLKSVFERINRFVASDALEPQVESRLS